MDTYMQLAGFVLSPLSRTLRTGYSAGLTPRYWVYMGESNGQEISTVLSLVKEGKFRAVVDSESPYPLTTEGVRSAFQLLAERKGHGKIVVKID